MVIFGAILAGGQGRRMGGADKAFLPLAGRPLIAQAIDRLGPQVAELAISANGDASRFATFALPVLPDVAPLGPLAGVLAALDWAEGHADAVVTVAVDTPFFPCDLVPRLYDAGNGDLAIATSAGRAHPTFAFWPVALRTGLRAALAQGEAKVMRFTDSHHAAVADFAEGPPDPFWNLNTPADLAAAQAAMDAA
jgi:molybdopterin-guanine dinucleotide biosynthesis protein A